MKICYHVNIYVYIYTTSTHLTKVTYIVNSNTTFSLGDSVQSFALWDLQLQEFIYRSISSPFLPSKYWDDKDSSHPLVLVQIISSNQ